VAHKPAMVLAVGMILVAGTSNGLSATGSPPEACAARQTGPNQLRRLDCRTVTIGTSGVGRSIATTCSNSRPSHSFHSAGYPRPRAFQMGIQAAVHQISIRVRRSAPFKPSLPPPRAGPMTSRSGEVNLMTLHARPPVFHVCIQTVVVAPLVGGIPQRTSASDGRTLPRVRDTGDSMIAALIQEGTERSPTFRRLINTIDATNGLVYVEQGNCHHHVRACLVLTVQVAGPYRLLRIIVDIHTTHGELLASIGHELQHAVEALSDPHVTDATSIFNFFDRVGQRGQDRFETIAATQAGLEVLAEWRASTR
jgi:hypothetical protein